MPKSMSSLVTRSLHRVGVEVLPVAQSDIADCRADLLAILFASPRSVETSAGRCDAADIVR